MLVRVRSMLGRGVYPMKVAIFATMIVSFVVSPSPLSWMLLAAIVRAAIDVCYPQVKRLLALPDWAPNEAYITKVHRRFRAP
jgi:hypothetical protein